MDNILYLQKMKQFFIRRGKKNVLENIFQTYFMRRAIINKENMNNLLLETMLNSVPYVKLRSRRKGTRTIHKIGFLEKDASMRSGLLALSKKVITANTGNFSRALDQELTSLSTGKNTIRSKRDELHKTALENMPFSWGFKSVNTFKSRKK